MTKEKLKKEWESTLIDLRAGGWLYKGELKIFPKITKLKKCSVILEDVIKNSIPIRSVYNKTKIYTEQIDPLNKIKEFGKSSILITTTSSISPAPGVFEGINSSEDFILRRTNLAYSLFLFSSLAKDLLKLRTTKDSYYPLSSYSVIYSPAVCVYKDDLYRKLENGYLCDIISSSPLSNPELNESGEIIKKHLIVIKNKIRSIFRACILIKRSKLVISDWGCDGYGNPPYQIAKCFDEVLKEDEFSKSFFEICFAVPNSNSFREFNKVFNVYEN